MLRFLNQITNVQSAVGMIGACILLVIIALIVGWGMTCLFVYWISLLWANTPFAFEWSWEFATGVWLALCLIGSFCGAKVKIDD